MQFADHSEVELERLQSGERCAEENSNSEFRIEFHRQSSSFLTQYREYSSRNVSDSNDFIRSKNKMPSR